MVDIALGVLKVLAGLFVLIAALSALYSLLQWIAVCALAAISALFQAAVVCGIEAANLLTRSCQRLAVSGFSGLWNMMRQIGRSTARVLSALAWLMGKRSFGRREEKSEDAPPERAPQNEYDAALELLGLLGVAPLTRDVLKRRYTEIIRIVHPDKGFPNRLFAQQVNEAVATIKRRHGWR